MQIDALVNAGCKPENVHSEHISAAARRRPKLEMALLDARRGDTFVVWKLDRFGRDLHDLLGKMKRLEAAGIGFRSLTEGIDTTTAIGRLVLHVVGAIAEFERDLTKERTAEGIRAHQRKGGTMGQPPKLAGALKDKAAGMLKRGKTVVETAVACKVSPGTIYNHFPAAVIAKMRDCQT